MSSMQILLILAAALLGAGVGWVRESNEMQRWLRNLHDHTRPAFSQGGVLFLTHDGEWLGHLELEFDSNCRMLLRQYSPYFKIDNHYRIPESVDEVHRDDFDFDQRKITLRQASLFSQYRHAIERTVSIMGDTTEISAWLDDHSTKAGNGSQVALTAFELRAHHRYQEAQRMRAILGLGGGAFVGVLVAGVLSSWHVL